MDFQHLIDQLINSPWLYLGIFLFAAVDSFFPIVPSESLVITAGVFAASGDVHLTAVIATAAVGAVVGDHIAYSIGHGSSGALERRLGKETKRRKTFDWAAAQVARHGAAMLVVARFIPGGRTATTLAMGATRYRLRVFTSVDILAGILWGTYAAFVGYIGGAAFEDRPLLALAVGFGIATGVTLAVEGVRYVIRRRRKSSQQK